MNSIVAIQHLQQEARIRPLLQRIEIPEIMPSGDLYFDLLKSIVSQQLSVKAADVIFKRFIALFDLQYPMPEILREIDLETLRSAGLSAQKARYLQNVAHFALQNNLSDMVWDLLSNDEIISFLTQIKGVGVWTAQMLLIFSLSRTDVFPVDDLGIQQAMQRLFQIEEVNPRKFKVQIQELSEPWRPYRTVACQYLWRWKDS
jgi:DNA-3-methyladenine glycosylase II